MHFANLVYVYMYCKVRKANTQISQEDIVDVLASNYWRVWVYF